MWSRSRGNTAGVSAKDVALASVLLVLAGCTPHVMQPRAAPVDGAVVHDGSTIMALPTNQDSHREARAAHRQRAFTSAGAVGSLWSSGDPSDTGPPPSPRVPETGPPSPAPPVCRSCP